MILLGDEMADLRLGVVHWFDNSSGEGSIIDKESGAAYYVHYSAINSKEKFKKLERGQEVEFKLYQNLYMKQVDEVWVKRKPRSKQSKQTEARV